MYLELSPSWPAWTDAVLTFWPNLKDIQFALMWDKEKNRTSLQMATNSLYDATLQFISSTNTMLYHIQNKQPVADDRRWVQQGSRQW